MEEKTNVKSHFKKRFAELRAKSGLSQSKLGKALSLSPATIGYYENGDRLPDIETAARIAEYFNVSADYLLGLSDAMSIDHDMKTACAVTGLSEDTIKKLQEIKKIKADSLLLNFSGKTLISAIEQCIQSFSFIDLLNEAIKIFDKSIRKSAFAYAAAEEYVKLIGESPIAEPAEALTAYYESNRHPDEIENFEFFYGFSEFCKKITDAVLLGNENWEQQEWGNMHQITGEIEYYRYLFAKDFEYFFDDLEFELYDLDMADVLKVTYSDILQNHSELLKNIFDNRIKEYINYAQHHETQE
mgnify:CR=1 FL=1